MPINSTTSQRFCCRHCGADVAIEVEQGGDLSYQCQNDRCRWAGSVDCPEALALKPKPIAPMVTLTTPAARKAAYNAAQGVKAVRSQGGYLIPSATRNVIHFVGADGRCSCEAGQSGKACWHVALVALDAAA